MNDYWQDDERVWRQRDAEKQKPLSVTLKKYSLTIAAFSMLSHVFLDGLLSVSLLSAVMFTYVLSYRKARVNVCETYYDLRRNYYKYLAYLALFLAFTENLQMMSEAESYTPPPPPPVYARRMPRYAAAG
ncbi:hypothetical protein B9Z55_005247 [Caenorhabditis nigoni]|uniref:Uncharacterized protein n=1 Tax=Caenorhabditis nigoni TaxID=1611254 RepID=A0A2G5V042_9PELO|nr:hypothetical protein B9Z55_005247 [Caenorhabditis nigoni]